MKNQLITTKKVILFTISILVLSFPGNYARAGDPFRKIKPRPIGENTITAFTEIFKKGNYIQGKNYLQKAIATEGNEPLAYAIEASLAYSNEDWETMKYSANKTLAVAKKLVSSDLLRGNLYQAVGHFLEGAHAFKIHGPLGAVDKLQLVFDYLDIAENIDPEDPELNLLKGYLDLILSVNLPFSSPKDAISRFERHAAPKYMVNRALFAAYRDLEEYTTAMKYINMALHDSPNNPELQYLKGQLLRKQGKTKKNNRESLNLLKEAYNYFDKAMIKFNQLPKGIQIPLRHDHRAIQDEINSIVAN
jgi:tetratricopeptide (TPR) repeat protein